MQEIENTFIEYKDLPKKLFEFYQFGYIDAQKISQQLNKDDFISQCGDSFQRFCHDFNKHILGRLGTVFESAQYVSIEFSYVETEWKDMISLHYINTTYAAKLLPRTIRVHFFTANICSSNNYLGFITLRPIEELQIALSYVFVNWDLLKPENAICKFVGYEKKIHCFGEELVIYTYPLLTQDTIVTCCADVNIITLSRFLAHKFGGKKLEIRDICGDDYNVVYPRQVTAQRFEELCSKMHIPFKTQNIYLHVLESNVSIETFRQPNLVAPYIRTRDDIMEYIDAYLDSNLPVVIFIGGHVMQLVGYRYKSNNKEYLVLDDSGFNDPNKEKRFCYYIDIDTMLYIPFSNENETDCDDGSGAQRFDPDFVIVEKFYNFLQKDIMTIGIPQSERVYIDFYYYKILLVNMVKQLWSETSEQYSWFLDSQKNFLPNVKTRSRLVDCTQFIEYLSKNCKLAYEYRDKLLSEGIEQTGINGIIDNLESAISKLSHLPLPHYLWYTELSNGNEDEEIFVGLCADATRFYKDTTHLDKVFYNCLFDDDKRGIAILESMWA